MARIRSILSILLSILVGVGHDPRVVAAARSLVILVVGALLDSAVAYVQGPGAGLAAAPVLYVILRYAEGAFDKYREQKAQDEYRRITAEIAARYPTAQEPAPSEPPRGAA